MRRILLLVNPLFERRNRRDIPRIINTLKRSGAQVEVQETTAGRGAGDQARIAIDKGTELIVVCGGDGTVFDVLQGMAGSPVPLGIVPFGTGNILAQNLHIPKHPVAAAQWILAATPRPVPLGKITHRASGIATRARETAARETQSWYFAMSAGMGVHAAMLAEALRAQKDVRGRAAYFLAGIRLLFQHALEPFSIEFTTTSGVLVERQVCEAIAVRVAELNLWRPGGSLDLPFLRLATVATDAGGSGSRWQLARAALAGLFLAPGARDRKQAADAPACYEDVLRIVCRPIAGFFYQTPLAVQADGEVFDANCAVIEMAGVDLQMLSSD